MRYELWRAILATRGEVDKLVASAVGDYPDHAPPRAVAVRPSPRVPGRPQLVRTGNGAVSAAPRMTTAQDTDRVWIDPARQAVAGAEHETLHRLHHDVHARIEVLRGALAAEPGGEQAMHALVLYFDEHIMDLLPDFLATSWPLLQTRLTGRKTGGSDFFRLIDRLMEAELQPGFVFEVFYFCLGSGFQGQYADDLAALERYTQRVRSRIAAPVPQRPPRELAGAPSPTPLRSRALYYAAAVAVIVIFAVVVTVWSNQ